MDYYTFISQPRFFSYLLEIDRSIANEAHSKPCQHCGGRLNRADFSRVGYGLPEGSDDDLKKRFSFCCRNDGCRKRFTPESLRFMYRRGYVMIIVLLLSAIVHGPSARRVARLAEEFKVSRQTIYNWLKWWRNDFASSPFWKGRRGRLPPSAKDDLLPQCKILSAFMNGISNLEAHMQSMLRFLASYHPNFSGG